MNPHYKEPVLIFGLIAPLFLVVVVFGLGIHFRSKFEATYKVRQGQYASYKKVKAEREALTSKINAQEPHMNRWMALFEKATGSNVKGFLSEFQKKYDGKEFVQTLRRFGIRDPFHSRLDEVPCNTRIERLQRAAEFVLEPGVARQHRRLEICVGLRSRTDDRESVR